MWLLTPTKERLTLPAGAAVMLVVLVVPAVLVVAAAGLQLEHLLSPSLQCAVVYVLHHHEHVCYHKVPAWGQQTSVCVCSAFDTNVHARSCAEWMGERSTRSTGCWNTSQLQLGINGCCGRAVLVAAAAYMAV